MIQYGGRGVDIVVVVPTLDILPVDCVLKQGCQRATRCKIQCVRVRFLGGFSLGSHDGTMLCRSLVLRVQAAVTRLGM